jgi:EAL and modified HD-GYP domain-containing signal transduction protein
LAPDVDALPTPVLVVLRVLAHLEDREAGFERLDRTIGRDPELAGRLLALANSAELAAPRPAEAVRDALLLLGISRVRRWAVLEVMRRAAGARGEVVRRGLTRARACELLGAEVSGPEREDLYLAGLLSVVDELLGVPMPRLAACIPFSARVGPALLHGVGDTGEVLRRVLDHEHGRGPDDPRVADAWRQATAWAADRERQSLTTASLKPPPLPVARTTTR